MKKLFTLFTFLAFCLPLYAVDVKIPDQKILGAESAIPLGELVELKLSPLPPDTSSLYKTSYYKWNIFEVVDGKIVSKVTGVRGTDTNSIYFAAGIKQKKLLIVVDVAYFFANSQKVNGQDVLIASNIGFNQIKSELSIGGSSPNPQPGPNPDPPTPVFPASTYSGEKLSWDTARTANLDKDVGATLSTAAKKTIDAITEETTLEDALSLARKNNQDALKPLNLKRSDISNFLSPIEEKVYSLYKEDKVLKSASDYVEFLKEIKTGLDAYSK